MLPNKESHAIYSPDILKTLVDLLLQGHFEQAQEHCVFLLKFYPKDIRFWFYIGLSCFYLRRFEEAIDAYQHVLDMREESVPLSSVAAVCRFTRFAAIHQSTALIITGKFKKGFEMNQYRLAHMFEGGFSREKQWKGEPLGEKTILVLLNCWGLGDAIFFMRYVPLIQQEHPQCKLLVSVQQELYCLFQHLGVPLLSLSVPEMINYPYDCFVHLSNLPLYCKTDISNVPPPISLPCNKRPVPKKIALAWGAARGGPITRIPEVQGPPVPRMMEVEELLPLLQLPQFHFVSLQKPTTPHEEQFLDQWGVERPVLHTFTDTVRILESCELVISVDCIIVHLAATMGIPTWMMHCYNGYENPFWLASRRDTPWYPSVTLFSQEKRGSWREVVQAVLHEVTKFGKS